MITNQTEVKNMNKLQTEIEKIQEEVVLAKLDNKITEIDLDLTALHNNHDCAVDLITEWTLENLDIEDYDLLLKYLIANRRLHETFEEKGEESEKKEEET